MLNWENRENRIFKKVISLVVAQVFFVTSIGYPEPSDRSLFKNRMPDYKVIQEQRESALQQKKEALSGKIKSQSLYKQDTKHRLNLASLKDISSIYIPEKLGKVVEVYEAPSDGPTGQRANGQRLIVHIQDLHTNPEAQYNEASILEILIKDYDLGLVCSEGAEGEVDTSSVSSFPDPEVREKTARLFVESGELTAEEFISITKYPNLPIWGIEDKEIYFQNIIEYNKIMGFLPNAMVFINQVKDALEGLKPRIYSKTLLELDAKEKEFEENKIDTSLYLDYLLKLDSGVLIGDKFKNITLLKEGLEFEKKIDQNKIMEESQTLLKSLQNLLSQKGNKFETGALLDKATLFKEQKISPFSFYSYLDKLARRHLKDDIDKYPGLFSFVAYLEKVNSLDSARLFQEIEDLAYEIKDALSTNENQKLLTKSIRHIKAINSLFNLKVSNEELDYYLANRDDFKVSWFKTAMTSLTNEANYIDYNPDLIDMHLPELEHFYEIAKERDIEMIENATSEIEKRNVKVATLITGGFHTRGLTTLLKEKGYSYVVISPYSSTEIDEENYKMLLSGKRKPISEIIEGMNSQLRVPLGSATDRIKEIYADRSVSKLTDIDAKRLVRLCYENNISLAQFIFFLKQNKIIDERFEKYLVLREYARKNVEELRSAPSSSFDGLGMQDKDIGANQLSKYMSSQDSCYAGRGDMRTVRSMNKLLAPAVIDRLIPIMIGAANKILEKYNGMARRVDGDELGITLPGMLSRDEVNNIRLELQLTLSDFLEGLYGFIQVENPGESKIKELNDTTDGLSGIYKDGNDYFLVFRKSSGISDGIKTIGEIFTIPSPRMNLGILDKADYRTRGEDDCINVLISVGRLLDVAKDRGLNGAVSWMLKDVDEQESSFPAKKLIKIDDSSRRNTIKTYSGGKLKLETYMLEDYYPVLKREYLFEIINMALRAEPGFTCLVRGPPDNFYIVAKRPDGMVRLMKIELIYKPRDRFVDLMRAKIQNRNIDKDDLRARWDGYGFKVINDVRGTNVGNSVILAEAQKLKDIIETEDIFQQSPAMLASAMAEVVNGSLGTGIHADVKAIIGIITFQEEDLNGKMNPIDIVDNLLKIAETVEPGFSGTSLVVTYHKKRDIVIIHDKRANFEPTLKAFRDREREKFRPILDKQYQAPALSGADVDTYTLSYEKQRLASNTTLESLNSLVILLENVESAFLLQELSKWFIKLEDGLKVANPAEVEAISYEIDKLSPENKARIAYHIYRLGQEGDYFPNLRSVFEMPGFYSDEVLSKLSIIAYMATYFSVEEINRKNTDFGQYELIEGPVKEGDDYIFIFRKGEEQYRVRLKKDFNLESEAIEASGDSSATVASSSGVGLAENSMAKIILKILSWDIENIRDPNKLCGWVAYFTRSQKADPYKVLRIILEEIKQAQYIDVYEEALRIKISKIEANPSIWVEQLLEEDWKLIDTTKLREKLASLKPLSQHQEINLDEIELSPIGHGIVSSHLPDEVADFRAAVAFINQWVMEKRTIREAELLRIHKIIASHLMVTNPLGIRRPAMGGSYRIFGAFRDMIFYAEPGHIPALMKRYVGWLNEEQEKIDRNIPDAFHPVELAAQAFYRLICIHPFENGNTRVASLIMNYILLRNGYPPFILTRDNEIEFYRVERFMKMPTKQIENSNRGVNEDEIFTFISDEYTTFLISQIRARLASNNEIRERPSVGDLLTQQRIVGSAN